MKKIFSGRIFADHYQFYLLDGSLSVNEWPIEWNPVNTRMGYISNGKAIAISTVADFNSHWIDVYLCDISPSLEDCERGLVFNINIPSGEIEIRSPVYEEARLQILPGHYVAYILAYSLGREEELLEDSELEERMDLERYKIVFVPGSTMHEGVIKGNQYLP